MEVIETSGDATQLVKLVVGDVPIEGYFRNPVHSIFSLGLWLPSGESLSLPHVFDAMIVHI